jgi:hypothetical protein
MPLRETYNARRYNERITLTYAEPVVDEYGHPSFAEPVEVLEVYAYVRQMSATKTMLTFQQADIIGLDIEFRTPNREYNGIRWRGHDVFFAHPEDAGGRGRTTHITGWYQQDNP